MTPCCGYRFRPRNLKFKAELKKTVEEYQLMLQQRQNVHQLQTNQWK